MHMKARPTGSRAEAWNRTVVAETEPCQSGLVVGVGQSTDEERNELGRPPGFPTPSVLRRAWKTSGDCEKPKKTVRLEPRMQAELRFQKRQHHSQGCCAETNRWGPGAN